MISFLDIAKPNKWPTKFQVIVLAEDCTWENKRTFQMETKRMYVAVTLEWYVTAQGETIAHALHALETLFIGYAALQHVGVLGMTPKLAPEEYQRVATRGDWVIHAQKSWREFTGRDRTPIVHRCVLDMAESKMRAQVS